MPNNGAVSYKLPANGSYTIPKGYHNGSGKVTQSLSTQGAKTITPSTSKQTVSVNGKLMTGDIVVNAIPNLRGQYQMAGGWGSGGSGADAYYAMNAMPEGYYQKNGADWAPEVRMKQSDVRSALGITASKIVSGQSIAGVNGTAFGFGSKMGITKGGLTSHNNSLDLYFPVTTGTPYIEGMTFYDVMLCKFYVKISPSTVFDDLGYGVFQRDRKQETSDRSIRNEYYRVIKEFYYSKDTGRVLNDLNGQNYANAGLYANISYNKYLKKWRILGGISTRKSDNHDPNSEVKIEFISGFNV